jgi:FtsH-binding integral membrane protein
MHLRFSSLTGLHVHFGYFGFWEEGTMNRERALKVLLVLVGLLFSAGIYPVAMELWHGNASNPGDDMMLSLYITLGIFLLLAVRNPAAHRSLIAFTAWSSFAHAVVMSAIGFQRQYASERVGFWIGSGVLVLIGVAFIALARAKQPVEQTSAAPA